MRKCIKMNNNSDVTQCSECELFYPANKESCPNCGSWKDD